MVIQIPREELLQKVHAHRAVYLQELTVAQAAYRLEVAAQAREQAAALLALAARADADQLMPVEDRPYVAWITPPEDHANDFKVAVGMLEATDAELIELNEADYARYVFNEWTWRPEWRRNYIRAAALLSLDRGLAD